MHVLVIGGTGFIGRHVTRRLAAAGAAVTVLHRGDTEVKLPSSVRHLLGDRRDLEGMRRDIARLAPEVVVDMIPYTRAEAASVCRAFVGIARRLVAVSSMDVYRAYDCFRHGGCVEAVPLTEHSRLREKLFPYRSHATGRNDWLYDYDKLLVEREIMATVTPRGTILRLPAVYGPEDRQRRLFIYIKRMLEHRDSVPIDEHQADWRWTRGYVENVAHAIVVATLDDRTAGATYNVGEAHTPTEAAWIVEIAAAVGWTGRIERVSAALRPAAPAHAVQLEAASVGRHEPVPAADGVQRAGLEEGCVGGDDRVGAGDGVVRDEQGPDRGRHFSGLGCRPR